MRTRISGRSQIAYDEGQIAAESFPIDGVVVVGGVEIIGEDDPVVGVRFHDTTEGGWHAAPNVRIHPGKVRSLAEVQLGLRRGHKEHVPAIMLNMNADGGEDVAQGLLERSDEEILAAIEIAEAVDDQH